MSITGISEQDKIHKKAFHRRNDSGELDVFEAARYFSGATEVSGVTYTQKVVRDEKQQGWRGGRISLDLLPITRNSINPSQMDQNHQTITKEKKHKQPSSPGGRLASFLNSLFHHQTSSKKKKSKSTTTTQSVKDEDESPGGRRKRRSSISHFRTASATDSSSKSSIYSSSSSGFRTPPPLSYTPTKTTYKDLRSYSDHKPKYNIGLAKPSSTTLPSDISDEKFKLTNGSEKFKNPGNGFPEKFKSSGNGFSEKMDGFSKFDDGADSDSSSDLFELENYDLGYYSSGLPVYETTHMDSIKRGAPISNGVAI